MAEPMDVIKQVLEGTIKDLGQNVDQVQNQLNSFLTSIEPEVNKAHAQGDILSLNIIQDRIAGRLGRVSLGFIHRNRVTFLMVTMATIRALILLRP